MIIGSHLNVWGEIVNLEPTGYIACAALAVSMMSALYSKKQFELASNAFANNYRAQLSDQHIRYREAFRTVKNQHKENIRRLSRLAGDALTLVTYRCDGYDTAQRAARPLRHLLHESAEMVFYAFKGELDWQSGLNITHRIHQITRIEEELDPRSNNFGGSNFRRVSRRRYLSRTNGYPESDLSTDRYFCNLVSEFKSRIDSSRSADLLLSIQKDLEEFRNRYEGIQSSLRESVEYLEELIEEGEAEHFALRESRYLYLAMQRQKAILDTLSYLRIPPIEQEWVSAYDNHTSLIVHACTVLHAIQSIHAWGWERAARRPA